jgi:hypothetical protein
MPSSADTSVVPHESKGSSKTSNEPTPEVLEGKGFSYRWLRAPQPPTPVNHCIRDKAGS